MTCTTTLRIKDIEKYAGNLKGLLSFYWGLGSGPTIRLKIPWEAHCDRTEECPEGEVCSLGTGKHEGVSIVTISLKNITNYSDACYDALDICAESNYTAIGQALCARDLKARGGVCHEDMNDTWEAIKTIPKLMKAIAKGLAAVDHDFKCVCMVRSKYSVDFVNIPRTIRSINGQLENHFDTLVKRSIASGR